jgi:pyroglutamyl-peptidase
MNATRTLLLTGFGLWGDETYNSSWEAIRQLRPELPAGWNLRRVQLPVRWGEGARQLRDLLDPSIGAAISFGMCGRDRIRPERLAINLADRKRADADGALAPADHLVPEGPAAYWTGFDYPELIQELTSAGLPTIESWDAGGFLCNEIFYTLMDGRARLGATFPAGFVHLPHYESEGGLPLTDLTRAARICVEHALRRI